MWRSPKPDWDEFFTSFEYLERFFKITRELSVSETFECLQLRLKRNSTVNGIHLSILILTCLEGLLFAKNSNLDNLSGLEPTMEMFCE
tara:strand:- start:146 stop:409 length:264 start_codon:yes stop_codon:yes gene_type:complete